MTDVEPNVERELSVERRQKIAGFIQDTLKPARKTLKEHGVASEVIENFEAREYQTEAWNSIWQAREKGETHGLVHLATGLGKTSVAVFDYAKFRQERADQGKPSRALFVVHQNNILEQASERFGELLPETSRSFFSNRQKSLPNTNITFASFQALYNGSTKFPSDYFDYIVYDEAHHIEATTYKQVVEHFQPAFQLGLTATPVRMDEKDITEHFGRPLYSKTLPEAIAENHLATVNYNIVFDDAVKEAIDKGFDPTSMAEIQRLFDVQPRNEEIVRKIQEAQQAVKDEQGVEQVKTIVFCADLEHANDIAELLDGTSYHSRKTRQEQDEILKSFRSNGTETITVRDMFNEGVDIPDARLIVFLRSTSSETIFEQQLGRGLRKNKNKQEVTVLDFVANIQRITKLRELAESIDSASTGKHSSSNGDHDDKTTCITGENDFDNVVKIHGERSEFIFSQEMIDLLSTYYSIKDAYNDRIDWSLISNEELIKRAQVLSPLTPLGAKELNKMSKDGDFPNANIIIERFGSLYNFKHACGFNIASKPKWSEMTNDEIIELAKELSEDNKLLNRTIDNLSKEGLFPSRMFLIGRFGSVAAFNLSCEFDTGLSNEDIVATAKSISPDKRLSRAQINNLSNQGLLPSASTINHRFGSIVEFQRACGFEVIDWGEMTNDEIVEYTINLSPQTKLSKQNLNAFSREKKMPSVTTIIRRFGSILEFQRACGFDD